MGSSLLHMQYSASMLVLFGCFERWEVSGCTTVILQSAASRAFSNSKQNS